MRFLLECLLREKIGGGAEVYSVAVGKGLEIKIKGVEIEPGKLKEWLRDIFRCFIIRDLPHGFFAHNEGLSELLMIGISANREFVNYDVPLPSRVIIKAIR
ncbi:MAG: hypothetical protein Q8P74_00800 [bacterium]|nr:hypothetical protein [bacterium]